MKNNMDKDMRKNTNEGKNINKNKKLNKNMVKNVNKENFAEKFVDKNTDKDKFCTNCGKIGHMNKKCQIPITSYGVILIKFSDDIEEFKNFFLKKKFSNIDVGSNFLKNLNCYPIFNGIKIDDVDDLKFFNIFKNKIKFLMIQRRHSLGFLEFVRGRYNSENEKTLNNLFRQMTSDEIDKIKNSESFDDLWDNVWGKVKHGHINEYGTSKKNWNKLKSSNNKNLPLNFYTSHVIPDYDDREWGFPKGRRNSDINLKELDLKCAVREFKEETNFKDSDFLLFDENLIIDEIFKGTNNKDYKHVYYFGVANNKNIPKIDNDDHHQFSEVGDIRWVTFDEALLLIRPYHVKKKEIIKKTFCFIMGELFNFIEMSKNSTLSLALEQQC